jgi:hypothetical protein
MEDQFEFLQSRWMNDEMRPKSPGVGQNTPTADGIRRFTLFGTDLQQATVEAAHQFVTPTGGGYFFIPSTSAILSVIAATDPAAETTSERKAPSAKPRKAQARGGSKLKKAEPRRTKTRKSEQQVGHLTGRPTLPPAFRQRG